MNGQRKHIYLSNEMAEAIELIRKSSGASFSGTIRIMIADWLLQNRGVRVDASMEWGGGRSGEKDT